MLDFPCCVWAFSSCGEWGRLLVVVHGRLIVVPSLVVEHRLQACGLQSCWRGTLVVLVHRLSLFMECGSFLDQRSNPWLMHWQADSQPLDHEGSPCFFSLLNYFSFCPCIISNKMSYNSLILPSIWFSLFLKLLTEFFKVVIVIGFLFYIFISLLNLNLFL